MPLACRFGRNLRYASGRAYDDGKSEKRGGESRNP
jgi:hypothetical protein